MPYVTEKELDSTLDLPVQLAVTKIGPGDWLSLSSFCISNPQTLILSYLQLQLIDVTVPAPYALSQNGLGIVYIGLYKDYTNYNSPPANPLEVLTLGGTQTTAPIFSQRSSTPTIYSAPGLYSFILLSNLTAGDLTVSVAGQVRMTFDS